MDAMVSCREVLDSYEVSAGTLRPTEKKKLYEWDFLHSTEKSHLPFFLGWGKEHQKIGELKKQLIWI